MESNPDLCKELLELLLNIKIDRIEKPVTERTMKIDYDSKGIRFDVYVKDGGGRCFDIEIQTTNNINLAKRARYYQGVMDVDCLETGADYNELKESYVIFLCLEDAFNYGLPVYTFQNLCKENKEITMDDGTTKIFYNASKYDIMPTEQLKAFFSFLNGKAEKTPLTDKLNAMVKRAKLNVQWRRKFMTWEQELQIREKQSFAEGKEQGILQGVQQGINTGKLSIAKTMLENNLDINDIVKYTGLTEEQIKELKIKIL